MRNLWNLLQKDRFKDAFKIILDYPHLRCGFIKFSKILGVAISQEFRASRAQGRSI